MNLLKLMLVLARLLACIIVLFLALAILAPSPQALAQGYTGKPFSALSTASNNSTLVYNDRALGKNLTVVNTTNTQFFLKLYDKKSAPTCGTDTPVWRVPIPPQNTGSGVVAVSLEDLEFFSGIGFCLTGGSIADNDNTNAATGVAINLSFFPR